MMLLPREELKLQLHQAGVLAQKRLARGVRLNVTETTALLCTVLHELIRDGQHTVADLMSLGKQILGKRHVQPSVPYLLPELMIEGTFKDGTFLVTVHQPISSETVPSLSLALYGSFFPEPPASAFPSVEHELGATGNEPGQIKVLAGAPPIAIHPGRERVKLRVTNMGDRPIQVGSHYHFVEVNPQLLFDRAKAFFKKLDIAAGTAVRFEPGESKTVVLVAIGGKQIVHGGNNITSSSGLTCTASPEQRDQAAAVAAQKGFGHQNQPDALPNASLEPFSISREAYAAMYGPTTGDLIRLADTDLWIRIEKDLTTYGDELKFGGGKTVRENMGQAGGVKDEAALDLVITNALIVDWSGIYKADIGIKKGYIVGIGKAGNPDTMDGVTPGMVVGVTTEVIAGDKQIVTAGAIDAHVHFICPQLLTEAISSGITTVIGGGTGPTAGTSATTCTPSQTDFHNLFAATDGVPLNVAVTGKGNDSEPAGLVDQIKAGAAGLKLHEDWGSTPAAIDAALCVCDEYDVQANIHTDTLNESGFVEDTIAAFKGRAIHTYHTEGAGGGHAPDIIVVCSQDNVLPSSTNPTRPYCANTLDEHLDMLMVCHHLDKTIPEDIAFAESRIRAETVAAEDVLQDSGAISIISSDSQAMGRIGEVVSRTWRTAAKMKSMTGALPTEIGECDNERVKRYVSKYTINPALVHGMSHVLGDVAVGKLADLVMWDSSNFGVRPHSIIKGGCVAWSQIGEANASIPTVQPVMSRPMWGSAPETAALRSVLFVSELSITSGMIDSYGLKKQSKPVKGCRTIRKSDLKHNNARPQITVDAESYKVTADGQECTVEPATELPMSQKYMLF